MPRESGFHRSACRDESFLLSILPRPFDAESFHPAAEGAGVQIQYLRRAAVAFDHPVGLIQHRFNVSAFDVFQGSVVVVTCRGWSSGAVFTGLMGECPMTTPAASRKGTPR